MPKLQISLPDGSQLDIELTEEIVTIGRAPDNTIPIDDASVSSHHAQIEPAGDTYILKDLGSTNGTTLNGKAAGEGQEFSLDPGDHIRFGKVDAIYDPENADASSQELPRGDAHVAKVAKSSIKPTNFQNASPFEKKAAKKDPASIGIYALAALAVLAALAALAMVFTMSGTH